LAILLHKYATETEQLSRLNTVNIVGTDIDTHSLEQAERAHYTESALGDTPARLRDGYFPEIAGVFTMLPEVKQLVRFAHSDVLQSKPPLDAVHLLVCRNVVIYFEREAQDALFGSFHRALAPGGFLVLGKVETLLGDARNMFSPVNARERIFRKI
jgi:chemotaxis methyl-accepting protein methylase